MPIADNTVVSNSIKISRNFKLLYNRNGFQIRIPRPKYACAENFKYILILKINLKFLEI